MMNIRAEHSRTTIPFDWRMLGVVGLLVSTIAGLGCASGDTGQRASACKSHTDCNVGKVCGAQDECVEVACDQCEGIEGVTCHPSTETCTAIRCQSNRQCEGSKQCVEGVCIEGECNSNEDCPSGQVCNAFDRCVEPKDFEPRDTGVADTGTDTSTPDDTGPDVAETGPTPDTAPETGLDTGPTPPDTSPDTSNPCGGTCRSNQTCNASTGTCRCSNRNKPKADMCPPSSNQDATRWSEKFCQCVECTTNQHCDAAQTCKSGFCKDECPPNKTCSGSQTGACSGSTPFCVSKCCVECIQSSDCQGNDLCVDNTCKSQSGSCSQGSCPQGYTCKSGTCKPKQTSSSCQTNQDCPQGQVCKPQQSGSNQCVRPSTSPGSCGACNKSGNRCTCPGNLSCTSTAFGRACSNCVNGVAADLGGIFGLDQHKCPNSQTCLLLGSIGNNNGGGGILGGLIGALAQPDPGNVCLRQQNSSNP
jgi:hypothetical protein